MSGTSFSFPFSSPFGNEDVVSFVETLKKKIPPGLTAKDPSRVQLQDATVLVAVPTAINTCLIAAENITDNLRAQQSSDLELPSLYKRAFLVAYVTDEIALVRR